MKTRTRQTMAILVGGLLSIALVNVADAQEGWGTLKGQVVVSGDVPENPTENVDNHRDQSICLVDGELPKDDNIMVGEGGGLRDVFVMMYVKGKGADAPVHESYAVDDEAQQVSIDNVKCRFVPHALFVKTGQKVLLKNSDSVGHNCHIRGRDNDGEH